MRKIKTVREKRKREEKQRNNLWKKDKRVIKPRYKTREISYLRLNLTCRSPLQVKEIPGMATERGTSATNASDICTVICGRMNSDRRKNKVTECILLILRHRKVEGTPSGLTFPAGVVLSLLLEIKSKSLEFQGINYVNWLQLTGTLHCKEISSI
jgi:hypothetical protein